MGLGKIGIGGSGDLIDFFFFFSFVGRRNDGGYVKGEERDSDFFFSFLIFFSLI